MALVGLHNLCKDSTLLQQVGQSGHVQGIEDIHLQKVFVANVVSKERDALNQTYMADEMESAIVRISAVADSKRVVDGDTQPLNIGVDCTGKCAADLRSEMFLPASCSKLPSYSR